LREKIPSFKAVDSPEDITPPALSREAAQPILADDTKSHNRRIVQYLAARMGSPVPSKDWIRRFLATLGREYDLPLVAACIDFYIDEFEAWQDQDGPSAREFYQRFNGILSVVGARRMEAKEKAERMRGMVSALAKMKTVNARVAV